MQICQELLSVHENLEAYVSCLPVIIIS